MKSLLTTSFIQTIRLYYKIHINTYHLYNFKIHSNISVYFYLLKIKKTSQMKTKITLLINLMFVAFTFAQQGINYKAIIKDGSGNVVANDLILVQFTILQDVTTVYQETHSPTTDANGMVILNIGTGTPISGVFTDIDWAADDHFLNVQINTGVGLIDLGTTQFMAVPYALSAGNAATEINELSDGFTDSNNNLGLGKQALIANTTGFDNVANGYQSLYSNTTGNSNTANGHQALYSNTTGNYNVANGTIALGFNTTGNKNIAIGYGASIVTHIWINSALFDNVPI